ncbi:MAG: hypothetical protein J1E80_06440 [Desulfovibrionaceae bacterium]|nr:hypothetical protein [Desulfovibrionaceae bacterium]
MFDINEKIIEGKWYLHFEDGTNEIAYGEIDIDEYILSVLCDINIINKIQNKVFYVTGETKNYNITLYKCYYKSINRGKENYINLKIAYNQALIEGQLLNDSEQKFDGIVFKLSCFDSMMVIDDEELTEEISRYGNLSFSCAVDSDGKREIKCTVDFNKPISIQESLDILYELRCFFVFLYCNRVNIIYNHLKIKNNSSSTNIITLLHRTSSDKKIPNYEYEILPRIGENLLKKWSDIFLRFEEQIRVVFEILTYDDFDSARGLVTCIHAIEGFFRIIVKENKNLQSTNFEKKYFKSICNDILRYIDSLEINDDIKLNIKNSISHTNEVNLKDKITQLLESYLDEQLSSHFIILPRSEKVTALNEYISTIVNIRNYYAHLDQSNVKKGIMNIINDYMEIYNYKVSVFAFLYILIAKEYFKDDRYLAHRLSRNPHFPFSQSFYENRLKPNL